MYLYYEFHELYELIIGQLADSTIRIIREIRYNI